MADDTEQTRPGRSGVTVAQLERAARMYHENGPAAAALGITTRSFARLCRNHGIETPWARSRNGKG